MKLPYIKQDRQNLSSFIPNNHQFKLIAKSIVKSTLITFDLDNLKMPIFTSEFYCGLLIGVLLGFMLYNTLHQNKLHDINQKIDEIINLIKPKKRHNNKPSKPFGKRSYLPDIEKLWKNFKTLLAGLNPKFSFNQMAFEIYKLLNKQKAIAASTIRNFYLRRTTPRKKTIEAIQRWIDEEKKENVNYSDGENENEEIDNNDSKRDNEI
jgi:hypothetical protein